MNKFENITDDELVTELHHRIWSRQSNWVAMTIWHREDIQTVIDEHDDLKGVTVEDVCKYGKFKFLEEPWDEGWESLYYICNDAKDWKEAYEHTSSQNEADKYFMDMRMRRRMGINND